MCATAISVITNVKMEVVKETQDFWVFGPVRITELDGRQALTKTRLA